MAVGRQSKRLFSAVAGDKRDGRQMIDTQHV
jgi:hypothetical protein